MALRISKQHATAALQQKLLDLSLLREYKSPSKALAGEAERRPDGCCELMAPSLCGIGYSGQV